MTEMICIVCPRGCRLEVGDAPEYQVSGNFCPRGAAYGKNEAVAPVRVVTATCPVRRSTSGAESLSTGESEVAVFEDSLPRRVPVRTDGGILRDRIPALVELLLKTEVDLPVRSGDVLVQNWEDSGVSVVATRDIG
ncbi:MAG TPA: DUF1667 domain-containing protein [Treponemataceae bacterium]|nr:DUF1667 domain-containing protein [Treponemataceae bacterium]HQL32209.1 DUF1667 domain-containing protein [Treponemataceae bacterium]